MTVHPPISWDIWPFKHVVAAALASFLAILAARRGWVRGEA